MAKPDTWVLIYCTYKEVLFAKGTWSRKLHEKRQEFVINKG